MESNIVIILILSVVLYYIINNKQSNINNPDYILKSEYEKRQNELQYELEKKINELNVLIENNKQPSTSVFVKTNHHDNKINDLVEIRDRRVLQDPLYPMIGRTDRPTFDMLINNPTLRGIPTRYPDNTDTFRPIAISKDEGGKMWYILGRRKTKNSSKGEYLLWSNSDNNHLKIPLEDDKGYPLIKDFDNIPQELEIKSGIMNGTKLTIQELKTTDLTSPYV